MSERDQSVRGLAKVAVVVLTVALGVRWATTVWEWTITAPARRSSSLAAYADLLHVVRLWLGVRVASTLAVLLLSVTATVVVAVWTVRAHRNANLIDPGSQRVGRGWAVAATLVPLIGVVLLPRVHADLWRATEGRGGRFVPVVAVWWSAWVASIVVYFVGLQVPPVDVADLSLNVTPVAGLDTLISVLVTIWAGAFGWAMVRVSRRQEAWRAGVTA